MTVTLIAPIAMEEGLRFAIRESGRTVGAGVDSNIIEPEYSMRQTRALDGSNDLRRPTKSAGRTDVTGATKDGITFIDDSSARLVSLLFATTRKPSDDEHEIFSGERADETTFGKARVRVPEERRMGEVTLPFTVKIFGVKLYQQKDNPEKHFLLRECEVLEKDAWLELIRESGNQEALIFVHGFNVSFVDAVFRCAQVTWDIHYGGIPILFSWASRGHVLDYGYDRNSALLARDKFVALLSLLGKHGVETVHVLAHSMGNFAVLDALANHNYDARPLCLGEILMAAPDVDSDQYKLIAPKVRAAAKGMTLYASSKDKAMAISKKIAGGIPRAGDVPKIGPILVKNIDTIDVTAVGDDVLGLNHGVFAAKKSILNDVKLLLSQGIRPPSDRLAEINGMPVGHSPSQWWRYVY